jgi:hypothetical protein
MQRPSYRRFIEFEDDNTTPALRDEEEVLYRLEDVEVAFVKENPLEERMNVFITNMRFLLIGEKFQYDFDIPYITLHAVTVGYK